MSLSKQYHPPKGLTPAEVSAFCNHIQAHLQATVEAGGGAIQQSADVAAQVKKRTAPSSLHKHSGIDSAIMNYIVDLHDLSTRIRRYQYIERYRDLYDGRDKDLGISLLDHTHALKSHEIYVILERGNELLRFGYMLAQNLSLTGSNNAAPYVKTLKKEFQYRLRERHRMVHAHERPSLLSRMLALEGELMAKPEVAEALSGMARTLRAQMKQLQARSKDPSRLRLPENRCEELDRADAEAASLWLILKKFVTENVAAAQLA